MAKENEIQARSDHPVVEVLASCFLMSENLQGLNSNGFS